MYPGGLFIGNLNNACWCNATRFGHLIRLVSYFTSPQCTLKPCIDFEGWSWIHQRVILAYGSWKPPLKPAVVVLLFPSVQLHSTYQPPHQDCRPALLSTIVQSQHVWRRFQSTTAIFFWKICWMRSWHRATVFFRSWRKLRCRTDALDNDSRALKDARTAELNSIKEWFPGIDICPKLSSYAAWGVSLDWPVSRLLLSQCLDSIQISNSILSDQFCCEKPSNSSMLCPNKGHDITWFNLLTVIGFSISEQKIDIANKKSWLISG